MTRRHYLVPQIRLKASTSATIVFSQVHAKASARVLQGCDIVARVQGRPRFTCRFNEPENDEPGLAKTLHSETPKQKEKASKRASEDFLSQPGLVV